MKYRIFWNNYKTYIIMILGFLILISIIKGCEDEPKTVTKTVTKTEIIRDTITKVEIKEVPKVVYLYKYVSHEGKKKYVYVSKPNDSTIKANQYDTELKSKEGTANLKITTTGELLDVNGLITFPKQTITTTVTKTSAKSGLFVYTLLPTQLSNIEPQLGLIYQFKNKVMFMGGIQYNAFTQKIDTRIGLGIKIF